MNSHNRLDITSVRGKEIPTYAKSSRREHLEWAAGTSTTLLKNRIFNVLSTRYRRQDGRSGDYLKIQCADWVNICAVCKNKAGEDCLVLVRQFRHGSNSITLEFPGGVINADEQPKAAALREFREETGCTADHTTFLGASYPNAALMENNIHVFAAWNITNTGVMSLDPNEVIDVELVPISQIKQNKVREFTTNGIMLVSWYYFINWYETLK